jgi:PAS domain S-box-containing protein
MIMSRSKVKMYPGEPAGEQCLSAAVLNVFFQVAELLPTPISLLDATGRYVACNTACARFFGADRQAMIGMAVSHQLPPMPGVTSAQKPDPRGSGSDCPFETCFQTMSGAEVAVIVSATALPLADGLPGILCVLTDISAQKHTEQELRTVSGMLEAVIKASPLPITMVDTDFYVRLWNPAAEHCFGFEKEQVMDKIYPLWPDRDKESAEALKRFNRDEVLYGSEVLRKKNDGTVIRVKRYTAPVRDQSGTLIGTMAVLEDLTEQRRTESELLQAGKLAAVGELAAGIAHEINNPNMFMLTNAQVAAEIWRDASPYLRRHTAAHADCLLGGLPCAEALDDMPNLLGGIVDGALRIKRIVATLKDFCRQEENAARALVALDRVLDNAVFMLTNQIKQRTDHFSLSCAEDLPLVHGIAQQLEQVVINVLLNALQALADRSGSVHVTVTHDLPAGAVVIMVQDDGCGMTPETLARIQDPFFTTRLDKGGLGLGLSISSRIVQQHGGTLGFESAPGRGTTALVRLPAVCGTGAGGDHGEGC